ncbi:hypothetical protein ACFXHA_42555 [Nocardia sp. NPDC059240]|uniref:hypothetical protein n=1 Tax=Nocardia sp. NPDC059240 TaxID=3346786 RepID=UPI0036841C6E
MDDASTTSVFPQVPRTREWPVRQPKTAVRAVWVVLATLFGLLAVVAVLIGIDSGVREGHSATAVGAFGCALMFAGAGMLAVTMAWSPARAGRSAVQHHVDPSRGAGVRLRGRGTPLGVYMVYLVLAGGAAYGISSWVQWKHDQGDDLLPAGRNNSGGATFLLVCGVVALLSIAVIAVIMHWQMSVELYPEGVRRLVPLPFGASQDLYLAWDEIGSVSVGEFRASAQSNPMPTIDLQLKTPRPPEHKRLDAPERVALPVYALAADRGTVLAIVRFLSANSDYRALLARTDAPTWFVPPVDHHPSGGPIS